MALSLVYEYTCKNNNGYMMRFTNGVVNIFRFFKDTTYGSMEMAKEAAEIALNEFNSELGDSDTSEFYVRQVTRGTGITGLVMLVKGTVVVGFGVKNGNSSVIRFNFNDHTPDECWKKVTTLRSMYDPDFDHNTEMPEAIRSKIHYTEKCDPGQINKSSILGLLAN